jgi:hypothetical protein
MRAAGTTGGVIITLLLLTCLAPRPVQARELAWTDVAGLTGQARYQIAVCRLWCQ